MQGRGGRTIGINSEMDALPAMGHACGHNLIAISGVGVALGLKAALQARKTVAGKIVLLGTPGTRFPYDFHCQKQEAHMNGLKPRKGVVVKLFCSNAARIRRWTFVLCA